MDQIPVHLRQGLKRYPAAWRKFLKLFVERQISERPVLSKIKIRSASFRHARSRSVKAPLDICIFGDTCRLLWVAHWLCRR